MKLKGSKNHTQMLHDFSKMRWTSFSHPSHVQVSPRKEIRDKEVLGHLGFGSVPARQAQTKTSITPSYEVGLGCMNTHWKDNSEIFPTDPGPYLDSWCASIRGRNNPRVVLSPSQIRV